MVNKNYINGRAREYKIKKKFEEQGYIVLRTAGSHGFADLIALNKDKRLIAFIQAKPKDYPTKKIIEQKQLYSWLNGAFLTSFAVMS